MIGLLHERSIPHSLGRGGERKTVSLVFSISYIGGVMANLFWNDAIIEEAVRVI